MKQKKGVALLWAMITSVVILLIASIVANVVIKESRMTVDVENSVKAYAAAQSGVEWAKWYIDERCKAPSSCGSYSNTVDITDGRATVTIERISNVPGNPSLDYFNINSVGRNYPAETVTRKLFYKYDGLGFVESDLNNIANNINTSNEGNSFSYLFDYWRTASSAETTFVGYSADNVQAGFLNYIGIRISHLAGGNTSFRAVYSTNGVERVSDEVIIPNVDSDTNGDGVLDHKFMDATDWTTPYAARFRVDYIKDSALQVTFMKSTNNVLSNCTFRKSFDLSGVVFAAGSNWGFKRQMFFINGVEATKQVVSFPGDPNLANIDGDVLRLTSGGQVVYIDNYSESSKR